MRLKWLDGRVPLRGVGAPLNRVATVQWHLIPRGVGRFSPSLGRMLADGQYLAGVAGAGPTLVPVALAAGTWAGLAHSGLDPVYTAAPAALLLLSGAGLASGQAGVLAMLAFIVVNAWRFWRGDFGQLTPGYIAAVGVSWLFLAQLVLVGPQAARLLARMTGWLTPFNGLVSAVIGAAFVELWTRTAMIALRPIYVWRGLDIPLHLVGFGEWEAEHFGLLLHQLTWAALVVGLARWVVELSLDRFRPVERTHIPRRRGLPWPVANIFTSIVFTLTMAGLFTTFAGGVAFCIAITLVLPGRRILAGHPLVARWDGLMRLIPAVGRLVLSYAVTLWVGAGLVLVLRDGLGWRTMTTAAAAIVIALALASLFWPQLSRGEPVPPVPRWLKRLGRPAVKAAPATAMLVALTTATAAFAHHCSFAPGCECLTDEGALAALIAAAVMMRLSHEAPLGEVVTPPEAGAEESQAPDSANETKGVADASSPAWGERPLDAAVADFYRRRELAAELTASADKLQGYLQTRDGYLAQMDDLHKRMMAMVGNSGLGAAVNDAKIRIFNELMHPSIEPEFELYDWNLTKAPTIKDLVKRVLPGPTKAVVYLVEAYTHSVKTLLAHSTFDDKVRMASHFKDLKSRVAGVDQLISDEFNGYQAIARDLATPPPAAAPTADARNSTRAFEDPL